MWSETFDYARYANAGWKPKLVAPFSYTVVLDYIYTSKKQTIERPSSVSKQTWHYLCSLPKNLIYFSQRKAIFWFLISTISCLKDHARKLLNSGICLKSGLSVKKEWPAVNRCSQWWFQENRFVFKLSAL